MTHVCNVWCVIFTCARSCSQTRSNVSQPPVEDCIETNHSDDDLEASSVEFKKVTVTTTSTDLKPASSSSVTPVLSDPAAKLTPELSRQSTSLFHLPPSHESNETTKSSDSPATYSVRYRSLSTTSQPPLSVPNRPETTTELNKQVLLKSEAKEPPLLTHHQMEPSSTPPLPPPPSPSPPPSPCPPHSPAVSSTQGSAATIPPAHSAPGTPQLTSLHRTEVHVVTCII